MIKLIAADMDGTLLGRDRHISRENIEAIKAAEDKGIHFAISTGRAYEDVKPIVDKYNLNCECVVLNGGEYRDNKGNILEHIYIDKDKAKEIIHKMSKYNLSVEIYTNDGYYTTNSKEETFAGILKRTKTFHKEITSEEELYNTAKNHPHFIQMKYIDNLDEFLNSNVEIAKFVSFADTVEEINELKEEMNQIQDIAVSSSFVTNIEINNSEATKGKILAKVAKRYNIDKDDVAVFGDGSNDYSMFAEFKNSFAMENAIPEIKEVARFITESNTESGVGKGIMRILNNQI